MRRWQITIRAVRLLWRYRLRSLLLMLGAGLGVSGVVCSVNFGASGTKQILDQIRQMGTNVLIITPAQSRAIAGRARTGAAVTTLVERDYLAIRKQVINLTRSSPLVSQSFWNKAGDFSKNAVVVGCEPDFFLIKDWTVAEGESFGIPQERTSARVALLGHTVATDLFGGSPPVGQQMMINRVPFTVIGVLAERGQGLDVSNEDNQVYVPLTTAMRRLMNVDYYSSIVVEMHSLDTMDGAADEIKGLLHQRHHTHPNQPEDFQVQNQKSLLDTQLAAADRLTMFLRWIAASALLVSGLGIVAVTWIAVRERTREFGTRRALGATATDVFFQTILETSTQAAVGALLGLAVSWPTSQFISKSVGLPFVFDKQNALVAVSLATTLNVLFAILPSRKAASVSPMEALRYK